MPYYRSLLLSFLLLALALLTGLLLDTPIGSSLPSLFGHAHDPLTRQLLLELRLPRVLSAAASGALLACAGAAAQYQFRNALAEPGLIGVSGGAALAAALALEAGLGGGLVAMTAFVGGLVALWLTWRLAGPRSPSSQLILAGVAINALTGSLLTLLIATLPDDSLRTVTFWLMGSFASVNWRQASALLIALPPVWVLLWRHWRYLNLLQLGDAATFHAGYPLARGRLQVVALAALATSLVVANCGMIGFVGLMAPHLARLITGADARRVLLLAPLLGALLAVIADTISRLAIAPAELPVGVITSLAGAPFFLWLMRRALMGSDNARA
ncbi:iron ABC transporter permease [Crenobacter sp. SG2303]|uniref:Iron ABC transporter permease n=1 Tax=Crenobacter oryzisoli TaxID=3056844 RepID=A0ABT7XRE6_9NEIS|nr:iron ABC transporter permease [Crenobacter sp. SG2303]MDN0076350.1 iron ABC transporter permease [Crenobacter sp. SG2303]